MRSRSIATSSAMASAWIENNSSRLRSESEGASTEPVADATSDLFTWVEPEAAAWEGSTNVLSLWARCGDVGFSLVDLAFGLRAMAYEKSNEQNLVEDAFVGVAFV